MTDMIVLEGVTKRFPGVVANNSIDLAIRAGEVHVLLGENGAGKSTLIDMLSGVQEPDEGRILIDGAPARISSPKIALQLGIGTVFQHTMLVPTLTVAENLLLGGPWWQSPPKQELKARTAEIAGRLGITISLDSTAESLSLGEQQQVEILRALLRRSRLLILDESTSMLTPTGAEELGALMRKLASQGLAIIFITHKLKEAVAFGDRITVLKLGRKVGEIGPDELKTRNPADVTAHVVEMMFGARSSEDAPGRRSRQVSEQDPVLDVKSLSLPQAPGHHGLRNIDLRVRGGEILGIAGIDGNGQKQLAEVLAGQLGGASGSIRLDGVELIGKPAGDRRAAGLRYLTDDRLGEGIVRSFSVATNLFLKQIGAEPLWKQGVEQKSELADRAAELVKQYDVRTPGVHTPAGRLSGGNIQKILIAREMAEGARVVIFNKPTYGLDLANTRATRNRIHDIAIQGKGVLLLSTDLEELLELADRIAVMSGGAIVGEVDNGDHARSTIGRLMIGLAA